MKKLLALLLTVSVLCVFSGCVLKLSMPEDTDLAFWLTYEVKQGDFEGYNVEPYTVGGQRYYPAKYEPVTDVAEGVGVAPEICVIYEVTSYPDYSDKTKCVTYISVTDPEVRVYGLTINSTEDEFRRVMAEKGFSVSYPASTFMEAVRGKETVSFTPGKRIIAKVGITNRYGIKY